MFSHFLRRVGAVRWDIPAAAVVRAAGMKWRLAPGADLGGAPDLSAWVADGSAVVVKSNPYRTIYRVALPGGAVYVKHLRPRGLRAWLREVVRPPKARLEFENALLLAARGVPTVEPLAWGGPDSAWPGESLLVTRARDSAVPFTDLLEALPARPPAERRRVAVALGRFLAQLHDAGVTHPDPHPGNLLVEGDRFDLLDLHAVRVSAPLTWAEARANLVLFNRWFQLRAGRADRCRFWAAYRAARRVPIERTACRQIERATAASNLRFWAARVRDCLGRTRHYPRVRGGYAVRDLPADVLTTLDELAAAGRVLKDSRTSTVTAFALPGGRRVVLKRVNVRRWFEPLKNLFRPSAVLRSWVAGHALRDRWLPTPRPLAVLHRRRFGLPAEGFLLVEEVPGAVGLAEAVAAGAPLGDLVPRLARTLRLMHDRHVSHRDLKAANLLLGNGTDPVFVDLVGVRVGRPVSAAQRAKELARLNASFLASPRVRRADRLRFLRAYLAAGPALGGGWRSWWAAVSRATDAKVAKNRKSGRELK
ncbi:lipopolysaccharide kinase InaA family protein [Urbifossiella limnaea]|uniref:3-deoxy-D-manno-octulosonic-acid kinase n=1 Tax=Urbifossiella limnaea TaxID=2528023 RepID=A0A517XMX6_9BACT|nr:lipopolysaccharide kinase InaA family protein [Urbifossiella limnaea]QDU18860.1 3-deoxy-D-manno-octulosonic-acid kinase [Urbifossiella limnaea]